MFSICPQIFLFHNVTIIHPEDFTQCTTRGSFVAHWHETAYNMFTFSCLFLLPLIIMVTCYTRIFSEISTRLRKDNCECHLQYEIILFTHLRVQIVELCFRLSDGNGRFKIARIQ